MAKSVNKAAVTLGRKGGKKRAENQGWKKIPQERREEIARLAVQAREAKRQIKKKV